MRITEMSARSYLGDLTTVGSLPKERDEFVYSLASVKIFHKNC